MEIRPSQEGHIPFQPTSRDVPCQTFYKVFGDLSCGKSPVIVLHGGPAAGHEYLLPFASLWPRYGLPVILYDQIGCASSTHLPETKGDESFWTMDLFLEELNNLIDHLNLRNELGFHILGQSWGGMLGADFATSQPKGLRRLVLASGASSSQTNRLGVQSLRSQLPVDAQKVLNKAEEAENWDEPAAQEALKLMSERHIWRTGDPAKELMPAFGHLSEDSTVYETMYAKKWVAPRGSLDGWSCIERLHKIEVPTLVYNGEFDSSTDLTSAPFFENIPRVRWITFAGSGHFCHLEDGLRERVLQTVGDFLVGE